MYCYYCLHRFRWKPHEFVDLPPREKALVIAMINERLKQEKKQAADLKRSSRKR